METSGGDGSHIPMGWRRNQEETKVSADYPFKNLGCEVKGRKGVEGCGE